MHGTNDTRTVIFEPGRRTAVFFGDQTILQAASANGVGIGQPCGGNGVCGKCKVRVAAPAPPASEELKLLAPGEIARGVRLACRTKAEDGMTVFLDAAAAQNIQALHIGAIATPAIRSPEITPANVGELFGAEPQGGIFGLALDVGTTTLAASLVDLESGAVLAADSSLNPQSAHGDDVLSRISYAAQSQENVKRLQSEVIGAVNEMILRLARTCGIENDRIFHVVAAGNPTMEHLFMGIDPAPLGRAPFKPPYFQFQRARAKELGLPCNPSAYVDLMPNIAGHVGGDVTAGIYHSGLYRLEKTGFLIDLGTNSEMVVGSRQRLLACSAAAGPAFEGARIKYGMRAQPGAIEHARIDRQGKITYETIGGVPAVGICGSGLVDLIAELVSAGVILESGRLAAETRDALPNALFMRMRKGLSGPEICIAENEREGVVLTQRDVREVQLAKGAIEAGAAILLEKTGVAPDALDRVWLAGAFGNYLDRDNALKLGILPRVAPRKIVSAGNTAGLGCVKALLSADWRREIEAFLAVTEHLELAAEADFQDRFVGSMRFARRP